MQNLIPDYVLSVISARARWTWRVTPPKGEAVTGEAVDHEAAVRSATFAAAVMCSLERGRRRDV